MEAVARLGYRRPLDWDALFGFLAPRAIPGVEEVRAACYRRTLVVEGRPAILEVEPHPDVAEVEIRVVGGDAGPVTGRVQRLMDLDADPHVIDAALSSDPVLAPLVAARPGMRSPGAFDTFELAIRAVLGQQVTVAAATTLSGRLVRMAGRPLAAPDGSLSHIFPRPAELAEADLSGLGVPGRRAATLRGLARAVAVGAVALEGESGGRLEGLLALPGIGPWTVSYIAMRGMGDADAFPVADLGIRRAAEALGLPAVPIRLTARAESWRPWRSYAVHHLWATLGGKGG